MFKRIVSLQMEQSLGIESCVSDPKASGKFRVKVKKLLLTYKDHIPNDFFDIEIIQKKINMSKKKYRVSYILQHEVGETEYPHTHIFIEFDKQFETMDARYFDLKIDTIVIHPNIQPIYKTPELVMEYVLKTVNEPEKSDRLTLHELVTGSWKSEDLSPKEKWHQLVDQIQSCETPSEVFKVCKGTSQITAALAIWTNRPKLYNVDEVKLLYSWQFEFLKKYSNRPTIEEVRFINWYYDPIGNTGKSLLCKHLANNNDWSFVTASVNIKDIANLIMNEINGGWKCLGIIFDLPRTVQDKDYLYTGLECLSNGNLTNTKYNSCRVTFNSPHIIVFANFLPNYAMMSHDRWKIRKLNKYINKETLEENVNSFDLKIEID